ncbi:hypothetical protein Q31a_40050 [Aureliella helgolandensis]|uniref:Uncharacterized protein n=1 Tax=Aureliella helgolandensis TaxID=2527968 RepID=A0A518GAP7_9BACT|nr:hypothetical protein Q31a_40050 [Aureliella helgolandensis]
MTKRNPARYVVRFRLQTVLVLLTALAIPWGLICVDLHREQQRRRAVATQRHLGGHLSEARGVWPKATGVTNG